MARPPAGALRNNVSGLVSFAVGLLETAVNGNDQVHRAEPCVSARTIFVDTLGVPAEDFDLDMATQEALYQSGRSAAEAFLGSWDWQVFQRDCGAGTGRELRAGRARGER